MKLAKWVPLGLDGKTPIIHELDGEQLTIAGRILAMVPPEGFWSYDSMQELEKKIILRYWIKHCEMPMDGARVTEWAKWFLSKKATHPETIKRPFKVLCSRTNKKHSPYLELKPDVIKRADDAERNWRRRLGYGDKEELL